MSDAELTFVTSLIWQAMAAGLVVTLYRTGLFEALTEIELPGGLRIRVDNLTERQEALQQQVNSLRFLMTGFVTEWELVHLRKLADSEPFDYAWGGKDDDRFMQELIRLWDLRLITRENLVSWYHLPLSGDLKAHSRITKSGRRYLELLEQMQAEAREQ